MGRSMAFGTKSVSFSVIISHLKSNQALSPTISSLGFVNAQYRFVMNPLGDYTVHFADPDMCVTLKFRYRLTLCQSRRM
jgi:hypothetical protein